MNIVFVSLALNIHQVGISDELNRLTGGKFWFIETGYNSVGEQKGGENEFTKRPYLVRMQNGKMGEEFAMQIIRDADVMIYGAAPITFLKERVKTGKLTFI